jgi:hypothetical protein
LTAAAGIEDIQNHSIDCQADGRVAHPRMMICAALTARCKPPYTSGPRANRARLRGEW